MYEKKSHKRVKGEKQSKNKNAENRKMFIHFQK